MDQLVLGTVRKKRRSVSILSG